MSKIEQIERTSLPRFALNTAEIGSIIGDADGVLLELKIGLRLGVCDSRRGGKAIGY